MVNGRYGKRRCVRAVRIIIFCSQLLLFLSVTPPVEAQCTCLGDVSCVQPPCVPGTITFADLNYMVARLAPSFDPVPLEDPNDCGDITLRDTLDPTGPDGKIDVFDGQALSYYVGQQAPTFSGPCIPVGSGGSTYPPFNYSLDIDVNGLNWNGSDPVNPGDTVVIGLNVINLEHGLLKTSTNISHGLAVSVVNHADPGYNIVGPVYFETVDSDFDVHYTSLSIFAYTGLMWTAELQVISGSSVITIDATAGTWNGHDAAAGSADGLPYVQIPVAPLTVETCYGIPGDDPLVCSGHGACVGPDQCVCDSGYLSSDCSTWQCSGIDNNDPNVCSGHGSCNGPNQCICEVGWLGSDCVIAEQFDCFGIISDDPDVCSSHGQCIATDSCQCEQAWTGSMCEQCVYSLKADVNRDCIVNIVDFAEMASVWLVNCIVDPGHIECIIP